MKKFLSTLLVVCLILAAVPFGAFNMRADAATSAYGTTSSTNYTKLRNYINNYGVTNSDGNKTLVYKHESGNYYYFYAITNKNNGISFEILSDSDLSSKVPFVMNFLLTDNSKYISVDFILLYYSYGSCLDAVEGIKTIDRSTYSSSKTYTLSNSGIYIKSSDFSELFNSSLELLCLYWDTYIYSELGFGLKGLGFISYSGKGSTVCDIPSAYHKGGSVIRNAYDATCTTDGYTGDTCCSACGTKLSSGSVIKCVGHHTYTDDCDDACNVCNGKRVAPHTGKNACDTTCIICGAKRTVTSHSYNDCITGEVTYSGEWNISAVDTSGVYEIAPKTAVNEFKAHYLSVFDKNGNEVKYNDKNGGWPLLKGENYTVKLRYCEDLSAYDNVVWKTNLKANTIFPDTTADGWYNDAVTYAVGAGIMTGYKSNGLFGTSDSIQRQDFIVMLARYDGVDLSAYATAENSFHDVDNNGYYAAAVKWGADKGIITGYTEGDKAGCFGVGDTITREQLVTMLYRYAKNVLGKDVTVSGDAAANAAEKFNDYSKVSVFSKEAVLWATEKGVITGKGVNKDSIDPQGNAQRCEVAQIMYNIFKNNIL